jgi:dTMP kinase
LALFITFEGGEGCGKSTQARALYRRVSASSVPVILTREPGGTPFGEQARRSLKRISSSPFSPLAELFLVAASRVQLVEEVIRPSLEVNTMVICDRYTDSTLAYQGYGRGIDLDTIQAINDTATRGLSSDLVILLDIPVEVGLARKGSSRQDRFEREGLAFHQRVREGYLKMAGADPGRWLVIDGALPKREIQSRIWERVDIMLRRENRK